MKLNCVFAVLCFVQKRQDLERRTKVFDQWFATRVAAAAQCSHSASARSSRSSDAQAKASALPRRLPVLLPSRRELVLYQLPYLLQIIQPHLRPVGECHFSKIFDQLGSEPNTSAINNKMHSNYNTY